MKKKVYILTIGLLILVPLSHFFLIPGLIKSIHFKENLILPVVYEVVSKSENKVQLYRKSSKGNIVNLDNERFSSARRFIRGISLDSQTLDDIQKINIRINVKLKISLRNN